MIYPVILTGGSGTRLWPLSRKSYPKQFQTLGHQFSLLQNTVFRSSGPDFADPILVTANDFRFLVQDQMAQIEREAALVLVEPAPRNTAPAILAATLSAIAQDPDALLLVLPSDHSIPETENFQNMVATAIPAAHDGQIVTFGVTPDRAETGYGYLELASNDPSNTPVALTRFVEKPDAATAEHFVQDGKHLWNAGIFLFRADVMLDAFKTHAADMLASVSQAVSGGKTDLGFVRLEENAWSEAEDISIDYAILEKVDNISVQRFNGTWSDVGSWDAVWRDQARTETDMALVGEAHAISSENSLLYSDAEGPTIMGIGLKDTIVVATKDAVLVADKSRVQDVKQAVNHLTQAGVSTANQTPRFHRPWGWYETLAMGGRFQVKRIVVKPGGVLSLQSHHHRSEHWVVVEGTARVVIDDTDRLVTENQSVYIPLGAVHRMENPGRLPMVLIEVQTGAYLGEDDIVRYEDLYDRS